MVSMPAIERLNERVREYLGTDQPRIGGMRITSPVLSDGSQELHTGLAVFVLSAQQMEERARLLFMGDGGPINADIHPTPGRIPMPADFFESWMERATLNFAK
jgi:hypothetical protein